MDVSVIIPVYNDSEGIRTTVNSLIEQEYSDYEIIIADNGSNNKTRKVEYELAQSDKVKVTVENEIQSSYAARNAGIELASGEILAFVDADMWVKNDYVESVYHSMISNNWSYMGYNVEIPAGSGTISRYNQATGFNVQRYIKQDKYAPTCSLVIQRELLEEVGTFDSKLISSGDLEFGNRVHDAGYELIFNNDITVFHPPRTRCRQHMTKQVRIGRGHEQLYQSHRQITGINSIWDLRNYLPVYPPYFIKKAKQSGSSWFELSIWYMFANVLRIFYLYGRYKQYFICKFTRIYYPDTI